MKLKTILVAGGAGFVGSHLCKKLLSQDNHVLCLDDLSSGLYQNIEPLSSNKNFSFIEADITNKLNLDSFSKVDEIFNLACPASPVHYQQTPIQTTMSSVLGSYNLLSYAVKMEARYLFTSTSEIYGDPLIHPQKESYNGNTNCSSLRACYVEGKRTAETLCYDFKRKHNLDTKVVRIFNTYGPNMRPDDGRVVSNFIVRALNNKNLEVNGDGLQTRSFCYVDDLISGLELAMASSEVGPINLGNPSEMTIKSLGQSILSLMDSKSKLTHMPPIEDEPKLRQPDISLATETLHWAPQIPLNQGLQKTIEYFKNIH